MKTRFGTLLGISFGFACATCAFAQEFMTLGEVKAQNAVSLSKEELLKLLPESTYEQRIKSTIIYWKHVPDGTAAGRRNAPFNAQVPSSVFTGKWSVVGDGSYCVDLQGSTPDDSIKWCRVVYKLGDSYFAYGANAPDSTSSPRFTLKK